MPHSPRWHDGRLWVLESGRGKLAVVDPATGAREDVAEVPGFARGLTFAGRYALIGLSRVREHTFDGLPLTRDRTEPLQCGVWIVDTVTGEIAGHLAVHRLRTGDLRGRVAPGTPLPRDGRTGRAARRHRLRAARTKPCVTSWRPPERTPRASTPSTADRGAGADESAGELRHDVDRDAEEVTPSKLFVTVTTSVLTLTQR